MRALVVLLATVAVLSTGCTSETKKDRFRADCAAKGGFVAMTDSGFITTRVDCIVNNRIVYLPGFD